jgi:hypothetical protein
MNVSFIVVHERIESLFVCRVYSVNTDILLRICKEYGL